VTNAELLLHPVRLRIVQAFLGGRRFTTAALLEELRDVAPATVYRQVATLVRAGVLEVVGERKVRGTVERSYRLRVEAATIGAEDARTMTVEEHRQAFAAFVAGLLADFDRYLERGDIDLAVDLVGYRQAAMNLSDEELIDLLTDLQNVIAPRLGLPGAPHRTRRVFTTILMPSRSRPDPTPTDAAPASH
jgi:hypothetical protein